jgi:arginine/ornithine transport system permease protein
MTAMVEYLPHIIAGALITLWIALASLALAVGIGLVGAHCKLSRHPVLRQGAAWYATIVRGVPELVWMLFLFFGAQIWLNRLCEWLQWDSIDIDPVLAGILTLGFIYGAYMTETFRGALLAVPAGQREAGLSLGMNRLQVQTRIVLPQMIVLALPGLSNNWMVLIKSTALVSVLGVSDLMHRADLAKSATGKPFAAYLTVCLVYLAITSVSAWLIRWLERSAPQANRSSV